MSNPSIQGGSDSKKHQPPTQEQCTPCCSNSLNQQSSDDGPHRLGSPRHQLHRAAYATTHGIRGCHESIGSKRNCINRGNQFFRGGYQPHHHGIGRDCVEREHQGFEPEHTDCDHSERKTLTCPIACKVADHSTRRCCR